MTLRPASPRWLLLFVFLCGTSLLSAQQNSPLTTPIVMHIGHLNPDCVQDTIYGLFDPGLQWIPTFIRWGKAYDSTGASLCDAGNFDSTVIASEVVDTTWIVSPKWGNYTCAISIDHYNLNDTLPDMIFWIRGIDTLNGSQGARIPHDTARALVVFGQKKLPTKEKIELGKIKNAQTGPFNAMALGFGQELINPKHRDNTKKISWELVRVSRDMAEEDTTASPSPLAEETNLPTERVSPIPDDPYATRIWPNPTFYTTNVEVAPLPAGRYHVEVISVSGQQIWSSEVEVADGGKVFETVDLSGLSSGHYMLRVFTAETSYGDYPVIVVK